MTSNTATKAFVVVLVGFGAGFFVRQFTSSNESARAAPSSTVPTLFFSSRLRANSPPRAAGTSSGNALTDGRERLAGAERHAAVSAQCAGDQKCQYSLCSRACSEWMATSYAPGEVQAMRAQQEIFIQCVGYCLHPAELAARVGAGVAPAPSASAR